MEFSNKVFAFFALYKMFHKSLKANGIKQ